MGFSAWRIALPVLGTVWLTTIGLGLHSLAVYASTPGTAAHASASWPAGTTIGHDASRPTLVLFAHPQCPCSRAAVNELAKVMVGAAGRLDARVEVVRPHGMPDGWERTDLWRVAAAIPGVTVVTDTDGHDAGAFGAFVSGQTFLYSASGRLLFAGGITLGRGHEGDNPGTQAVLDWIGGGSGATHTPVFGCTLAQEPAAGTDDGDRR